MNANELATPDNGADKTITLAISGNRLVAILNALDALMHRAGRYTLGHNSTVAVQPYDAAILASTEAIRDELSRQRCTHDEPVDETASMRLALQAIAGMVTDEATDYRALAALCVAVARLELAKGYDEMAAVVSDATHQFERA